MFTFTEEFFHHPFLEASSSTKKCMNCILLVSVQPRRCCCWGLYAGISVFIQTLQLHCSPTPVQLQAAPLAAPPWPIWSPLRWGAIPLHGTPPRSCSTTCLITTIGKPHLILRNMSWCLPSFPVRLLNHPL